MYLFGVITLYELCHFCDIEEVICFQFVGRNNTSVDILSIRIYQTYSMGRIAIAEAIC